MADGGKDRHGLAAPTVARRRLTPRNAFGDACAKGAKPFRTRLALGSISHRLHWKDGPLVQTGQCQPGALEMRVRFPRGPLQTPVVKRTSCLASNEAFRVRLLVGVLAGPVVQRQDIPVTWGRSVVRIHPGLIALR